MSYYVVKNGALYMGPDGHCTPDRRQALQIDPQLVRALRNGRWLDVGAQLFAEVDADDGDTNESGSVRVVLVHTRSDNPADDAAPRMRAGLRV